MISRTKSKGRPITYTQKILVLLEPLSVVFTGVEEVSDFFLEIPIC